MIPYEHMKKGAAIFAVVLIAGSAAGCGNTKGDRALSGAGLGAAAGAAGGALLGGSAAGGAILGGAAGAAAGALSDKDDVDLGKPIWRD